ncbi:MAG TPA: hypothetical protein VMR46_03860 [Candidatus Paceibacterota bacterium]|nr:hypothetical protein [Candidatus Paceibacterota bacterium]
MTDTSQAQIDANRENGKKGGVKTEGGKEISKYNALKHGILKEVVSDYEQDFYTSISEYLEEQFQPIGALERILVDRIGVYYLKLYRAAKAENEYMRSTLNPRRVHIEDPFANFGMTGKAIVDNEGYTPIVGLEAVAKLSDTYLRYETTIENRLYKALHELQRLQSARNGERVPPPVAIDVSISGGGENGFVPQKANE